MGKKLQNDDDTVNANKNRLYNVDSSMVKFAKEYLKKESNNSSSQQSNDNEN